MRLLRTEICPSGRNEAIKVVLDIFCEKFACKSGLLTGLLLSLREKRILYIRDQLRVWESVSFALRV